MFHPGETVEWVTMTHPKDAQRGTVESAARGTVTVVYGPFDDRLTLAAEEAERFLTRVAE